MYQNLESWYKKPSHYKGHLRYHLIFSTKYRRKCLNGIKLDILDSFYDCESKSDFLIHTINLLKDHIHILVSFPPLFSLTQIVTRMKLMTTLYIYRRHETYMRKFYYGHKMKLWTHGYFVSTIGLVSELNIIRYIENQ